MLRIFSNNEFFIITYRILTLFNRINFIANYIRIYHYATILLLKKFAMYFNTKSRVTSHVIIIIQLRTRTSVLKTIYPQWKLSKTELQGTEDNYR